MTLQWWWWKFHLLVMQILKDMKASEWQSLAEGYPDTCPMKQGDLMTYRTHKITKEKIK